MKNRLHLILFSGILLPVCCLLCLWAKDLCAAPVPVPSHPGGYYEDAFLLEFSVPASGTVYYTTDGSTPTRDSQVYREGIPIDDRSSEPNVCNAVQNVILDWKTYIPDPKPVKKGTVVRALFVNRLGMESEIFTQTYFVGLEPPGLGYTLSLIFEHDDLYGENGIYVTGKEYDRWYLSGDESVPAPLPNYVGEGEVKAIAELMTSEGDILNQPIGLKLQGRSSRREPVKRFTLVARTEYGGSQTFDIPFYEGVTTHSVMLKNHFPDALAADLLSDRSVATQRSVPVRVYLNGEYFYDTYMLERYDSHYFRQYYQVDNHQLVKNGVPDPDAIVDTELPVYEEHMYWVGHTDFSDPEQWAQLMQEIDLQSYIDYLAANYFLCNIDFNDTHNYVLWRSGFAGGGTYEDTRWRWCIYDIDALAWVENRESRGSAEAINVFSNEFQMDMHHTTLYQAVWQQSEFRRQFVLSFMDMLNNNFSPVRVSKALARLGQDLSWSDSYFEKRPEYAIAHLAEEFQLTGTPETVTVTTNAAEMGSVTVNTSVIDLSSGSWTGRYFTDYPITVTAQPKDGYVFLGWKGAADDSGNTLTLNVDGGITLEAVFAKEGT